MGFRAGIVGLPNVGKSTLFNALTSAGAAASNFPFCTIEPNVGVVPVPDERLAEIDRWVRTEKIVPSLMEFVDIAGLVRGASKGEGLGNQFLGKILEVDAIVHVVRCFEDPNIVHVEGGVDPLRDIATIETELILKDLEAVTKAADRAQKQAKSGSSREAADQLAALKTAEQHLNAGKPARTIPEIEKLCAAILPLRLLTAKKVLYAANVAADAIEKGNGWVRQVEELASREGSDVVSFCAALEAEIAELPEAERPEFLKSMGIREPGLNRLIKKGHALLGLISYFTAGPKEIRAWTIKKGWTAKQAAGVIHSDFEKGFIRAEVVSYKDFIECQGEARAKEKGKLRIEGKEYLVQDGDIMHFRFSV